MRLMATEPEVRVISSNAIIGANACIKDQDLSSNSIVFGESPNLVIKENRIAAVDSYANGVFFYD